MYYKPLALITPFEDTNYDQLTGCVLLSVGGKKEEQAMKGFH